MDSDGHKAVLVALGANSAGSLRHNAASVARALAALGDRLGPPAAVSRCWRTPAWPPGSGSDFVNACARWDMPAAALPGPSALLAALHEIEAALGRVRTLRWGPRAIDLDLLAVGDLICPDTATLRSWIDMPEEEQRLRAPDRLILPHPRMHERAFVLLPLVEVAPDWRHPMLGQDVVALASALPASACEGLAPL